MSIGRVDRVIPLAMKIVWMQVYVGELLVRDTTTLGIDALIDSALDEQTGLCRGGADQIHDDLMSEQRLAAPVASNEREQSMFNFVPLGWCLAADDKR